MGIPLSFPVLWYKTGVGDGDILSPSLSPFLSPEHRIWPKWGMGVFPWIYKENWHFEGKILSPPNFLTIPQTLINTGFFHFVPKSRIYFIYTTSFLFFSLYKDRGKWGQKWGQNGKNRDFTGFVGTYECPLICPRLFVLFPQTRRNTGFAAFFILSPCLSPFVPVCPLILAQKCRNPL